VSQAYGKWYDPIPGWERNKYPWGCQPLVTINVRQVGNATVLDLNGRLTLGGASETLSDKVHELRNSGAINLAINMSGVSYVDSSGLGTLVRVYSSVKNANGRCRLFSSPKQFVQLLKMTRLDTVLELFEDEASAIAD
jgi:anti-sigma B factor antagonist